MDFATLPCIVTGFREIYDWREYYSLCRDPGEGRQSMRGAHLLQLGQTTPTVHLSQQPNRQKLERSRPE